MTLSRTKRFSTTHCYVIVLIALFLLGGLLVQQGLELDYYGPLGPGAGFFPVWIGILLMVMAPVGGLATMREKGATTAPFFAQGAAPWRVAATILSLGLLWLSISVLGFRLSVLAYMLIAPLLIARLPLKIVVPTALAASFGAAYVFETWLLVRLPAASIPALAALGF